MRHRQLFISGSVYFITFRTEEGLPFVPLPFMNKLILSAMARAKRLYPVQLIGVTVQANHAHMLIRVIDPEAVSGFVGYFKTETSNYLNRLLNRRQRTVWFKRFDNPRVLDIDKAFEILAYILLNPVKDGLVSSMREYPGVSSYQHLVNRRDSLIVKSIPRSAIVALRDPSRPILENKELSDHFSSDEFEDLSLTFEPEALRLAFKSTRSMAPDDFRRKLIETLETAETHYRQSQDNRRPLGAKALVNASILVPHTPPKRGKKMLCVSSSPNMRKRFIGTFRRLCERCRQVFIEWKCGNFSVPFPPGMFAPHFPRLANSLPLATL